jgi:hypothetical protein
MLEKEGRQFVILTYEEFSAIEQALLSKAILFQSLT